MKSRPLAKSAAVHAAPAGNHGDNTPMTPPAKERVRIALDLPPHIVSLLDHVVANLGGTRTSWALEAVMQALPGHLDRADEFAKRAAAIQKGPRK